MTAGKKDLKKITLGDNNFAMEFFGKGGDNLKRLEKKLGVEINSRGTHLTIQGEAGKVALAQRLILELYSMVESGFTLTAPDVDYAIRMVVTDRNVRLKDVFMDTVALSYRKRSITPKSIAQKNYLDAIRSHDIVFGIGPAGTGKTYLAMAAAVAALTEKEVDRIILVRPAVEAGEKLGFLPGDMMAKVDPYLRPLYDALHDMMDIERAEQLIERGTIEVAPLAFMRGRTLNDSFVIMDEAQNTTREQMKMFLTRLGFSSKAVITGDITQIDLPLARSSGLVEAQKILAGIEGIDFVNFTDADVVRHPLVQKIIRAFEKADKNKEVISD